MPETARLGRPLRQWREAFLAYFDTGRASNGGTEAVNGLIGLHRRVSRGFRSRHSYRLRMILIAGGPTSRHLKQVRPVHLYSEDDDATGHLPSTARSTRGTPGTVMSSG